MRPSSATCAGSTRHQRRFPSPVPVRPMVLQIRDRPARPVIPALRRSRPSTSACISMRRSLLRASMDGVQISIQDYERFVTALKRMRLEIATVQHELDDALYNLDPLTGTPSRIGMLTKLREQQEMVKRNAWMRRRDDGFGSVQGRQRRIWAYRRRQGPGFLRPLRHGAPSPLRQDIPLWRRGIPHLPAGHRLDDGPQARRPVARGARDLAARGRGPAAFHVTVSFGITLLDPDLPVEQSIDRADKALYIAKTKGRNCVVALGRVDERVGRSDRRRLTASFQRTTPQPE